MKLFVTGAAGQLGHDIIKEAEKRGHEAIGTDLGERWNGLQMDITDAEAVSRTIREINPDIVYSLCGLNSSGCRGRRAGYRV